MIPASASTVSSDVALNLPQRRASIIEDDDTSAKQDILNLLSDIEDWDDDDEEGDCESLDDNNDSTHDGDNTNSVDDKKATEGNQQQKYAMD